jgi:hypothetical protein
MMRGNSLTLERSYAFAIRAVNACGQISAEQRKLLDKEKILRIVGSIIKTLDTQILN